MTETPTPEAELIAVCRRLKRDHPDIESISFKVVRSDDEWQSYAIGEKGTEHDPE
jgi:hypothetical protein